MRYVLCYGAVYAMTSEKFKDVIMALAKEIPFTLSDYGDAVSLSPKLLQAYHSVGKLLDISTMTPEEAKQYLDEHFSSRS